MSYQVLLVGAGVVGRAIACEHLRAGIEVWMADSDEDVLRRSCDLVLAAGDAIADSASPWGARIPLPIVHLAPVSPAADPPGPDEGVQLCHTTNSDVFSRHHPPRPESRRPSQREGGEIGTTSGLSRASPHESGPQAIPRWLVIESIAERLDVKQSFFAAAEQWFGSDIVLTTNTSTLRIASIAAAMQQPERLGGLHFFMPVSDREAVEVIPHDTESQSAGNRVPQRTSADVVDACCHHARRLGKRPLLVRDSPGFVVNRLLAPYLNLAIDLLCGGIDAETIRFAALRYGMPMSPLELIDLIGTRTAFDGGRVVWSAFPNRMDPSPLLPALVKRKLAGVSTGEGFYRYNEQGVRQGNELSPQTLDLIQRYQHDSFAGFPELAEPRIALLADLFAAAIRCEAIAIECGCVADLATIDAAMRGGLRWNPDTHCDGPIECLTPGRAEQLAAQFPNLKSIQPPQ